MPGGRPPPWKNLRWSGSSSLWPLSVSSPSPGSDHRDGSTRTLFVNLEGSITRPPSSGTGQNGTRPPSPRRPSPAILGPGDARTTRDIRTGSGTGSNAGRYGKREVPRPGGRGARRLVASSRQGEPDRRTHRLQLWPCASLCYRPDNGGG